MFKKMMCVLCVIAAGFNADAIAQEQEGDPNEILDASRQAIASIPGFSAQFRMFGDGSDMIASMAPTMSGQMVFGEHPDYGRSVRMVGQARDKKDGPPYAMDILRSNTAIAWTDLEENTINEHRADTKLRRIPAPFKVMMFEMLVADDPFGERMDAAESISLEPQEEIGGELCDVIKITYAKTATTGRQRSARPSYTSATWYIAVSDRIPRRIEHLTDGGMLKFRMITELTNLTITDPNDDEIDIMRTPNMTLNSTLHEPEPADPAQTTTPQSTTRPTGPITAPTPRNPRAPSFSFTDTTDAKITNTTQQGRVTVLYFTGSWCLPGREMTPEISTLAQGFGGSTVDIFEMAVRERDENAIRSAFARSDYAHRLVTKADETATRFGVRLYPTIIVINPTGEIVYNGHITKELDAQQLVGAAALEIKEALSN